MPKHHHFRSHVPASRALSFLNPEKLTSLLSSLVPEAGDREFLYRCLVEEGPIHHRGSNYLLVLLLGSILEQLPGPDVPVQGEPVPMRLPPHLRHQVSEDDFPLRLPITALKRLLENRPNDLSAAIDCLTDGPPQHVLGNVAMVALIQRILDRLEARP